MSIDLTTASGLTEQGNYNPVNPVVSPEKAAVPVTQAPGSIGSGFHAGTIDFTQSGLAGYDGVGMNQYGLYGINEGVPHFLLATESFDASGTWGQVSPGEFRFGDDVRDANGDGTLDGTHYVYFDGTNLIIETPNFTIDASGNVTIDGEINASSGSITGDMYVWGNIYAGNTSTSFSAINEYGFSTQNVGVGKFLASGQGVSGHAVWGNVVAGEFRIGKDVENMGAYLKGAPYIWFDGDNLIIETYNFTIDASGNVSITGAINASSGNITGDLIVSSGGAIVAGALNSDFAALNSSGFATGNSTTYTILMSGTGMSGAGITDDLVAGELRIGSDVGDLNTTSLRFTDAEGLQINGDVDVSGTGNFWVGSYPNGTGLNHDSFGMYVTTPRFRIEQSGIVSDVDWGTQSAGSVKFAQDIRLPLGAGNRGIYLDNGVLEINSTNFWIDASGNVTTVGEIHANSGTLESLTVTGDLEVTTGDIFSGDVFLNSYGISGGDGTTKHFVLSAGTATGNSTWGNLYPGEFRTGTNIGDSNSDDTLNTDDDYLWFRPAEGSNDAFIKIKANGIDIGPNASSFGGTGTTTTLGDLAVTGNLTLTGSTTDGVPSSYIGIVDGSKATYISSDGVSLRNAAGAWQGLLLGEDHPWALNNSAMFYVGEEYDNNSDSPTLGDSHIYFDGSDLSIYVSGNRVIDTSDYNAPQIANNYTEDGVTTISRPLGGALSTEPGDIGAIKITLPQSWTDTSIKLVLNVYSSDVTMPSFSLALSGQNYLPTTKWLKAHAQIYGNLGSNNRVRFGHDGTYCCIVIGDTTDAWKNTKFTVNDVMLGGNNYDIDDWDDGWVVSVIASVSGITFTQDLSDNLVDANVIVGQGSLATQNQADWDTDIDNMPPDADLLNDQQDWDDILTSGGDSLNDPTNSDWVTLGAKCYVKQQMYIGDESNYIVLKKNGTNPYIASQSTDSGAGEYAWKLDDTGLAKFTTISPTVDYLFVGKSDGLFSHASAVYQKISSGSYSITWGASGTNGGAGINALVSSDASLSLYADDRIVIAPSTSGDVTIGDTGKGAGSETYLYAQIIALNGTYVYVGADRYQSVGMHGTTCAQAQITTSASLSQVITALQNKGIFRA